ncbi:MAG: hypothetical protein SFU83_09145 [Meiothermus sp.]|nr:hypothetical protein [Meiothermus sp.]
MNIPRHWAKAERSVTLGTRTYHFVAWQGSDLSLEDARHKARLALEARIARKERGERLGSYPKDGRPLREEVVEEVTDADGRRVAVVTRNAAGCLVLNTARVMFVDLDFANQHVPWKLPSAGSLLEALTGWLRPRPKVSVPPPHTEEGLLHKVREWHAQHPDWTIRVYRTRAGLRLLAAHDLFDPAAPAVRAWMEDLGADLRYIRLCQSQACFRARLTPKPWRMKGDRMKRPTTRYPWASGQEERAQREWERVYASRIRNFSVCKVLANLGSSPVDPEAEQILLLHDRYVLGDKPLA